MNIFATSPDAWECAAALDDKRVGKMLMEACQMLSLAVKSGWDDDSYVFYEFPGELTSGWGHKNHPCSIWTRASRTNYDWVLNHAEALHQEFIHRFGKSHASGDRIPFLEKHRDCVIEGPLLPFVNCARNSSLRLDFRHLPVHEAYQAYLCERWKTDIRPVTFTKRGEPAWRNLQWSE